MDIQVEINDREVRDLLTRLRDRAKDLTPAMQAIGAFYKRSVVENFKAQTALDAACRGHPASGPGQAQGLEEGRLSLGQRQTLPDRQAHPLGACVG